MRKNSFFARFYVMEVLLMAKKQHKFLCLLLCLALVLSAVIVGTASALAAAGDTVYVKLNNGWSSVYCYMWTDGSGNNASWPGVKMTLVKDNIYSYKITGSWNKIIFDNGSGGGTNQTSDLSYPGTDGQIYDLSSGTWSAYSGHTVSTDPTTTTSAVQPTTSGSTSGGMTVFYKNVNSWSTPYCYMWNSSSDSNASWPGKAMTKVEDDVWMYTATKSYTNCIFSNNGQSQTSDLTAHDGQIYDNGTWKAYDLSDLRVTAYEADPASDIYPDMDVTLSADAYSKNGAAVTYKFSVTNSSGGTSVLADYGTAKSVTWTPATAGNYTVKFDFKDTDGNENSRELALTVLDDTSLVKPIIKSVSPANLNIIKAGTPATVTVSAGGGKTGTNLLFYKYIVTDPNGVKNTPYYTLNNTYQFTPTMTGDYVVNVYVQASDNSTVTKTYNYTASADGPIPTVAPTTAQATTEKPTTVQPTTQKPTTVQPTTQKPTTVQPTTEYNPGYQKGDANMDGKFDIKDATYVQMHVAMFDEAQNIIVSVADMSGDGVITVLDATLIQLELLK